jgi:hypothetical protein
MQRHAAEIGKALILLMNEAGRERDRLVLADDDLVVIGADLFRDASGFGALVEVRMDCEPYRDRGQRDCLPP